ncbi:hypothetical protein F4809DRAFT_298633 [Biscogniauxia mediterranea]|nr:hypothetical protein F4809DRAFT_298633 [Biscogniauxia mediterranea]
MYIYEVYSRLVRYIDFCFRSAGRLIPSLLTCYLYLYLYSYPYPLPSRSPLRENLPSQPCQPGSQVLGGGGGSSPTRPALRASERASGSGPVVHHPHPHLRLSPRGPRTSEPASQPVVSRRVAGFLSSSSSSCRSTRSHLARIVPLAGNGSWGREHDVLDGGLMSRPYYSSPCPCHSFPPPPPPFFCL